MALYLKRQFVFGDRNFFVQPKIGFSSRQYPMVVIDDTGAFQRQDSLRAMGPAAGIDFRRPISERFSIGARLEYFVPVSVSMSDGPYSVRGHDSYRNLSLGVQAIYWLNREWGLGAGAFIEKRSIEYLQNASGTHESIEMDGNYFFGSLIYTWGR
jgi:hypothetical protein